MVVGCGVGGAARLRDEGRRRRDPAPAGRAGSRSSTEGLGASLRRTGGVLWSACGTTGRPGRLERLGYERDLDLCLAEDAVPVVPRLVEGGLCERNYGGLEIFGPGANTESQNSS